MPQGMDSLGAAAWAGARALLLLPFLILLYSFNVRGSTSASKQRATALRVLRRGLTDALHAGKEAEWRALNKQEKVAGKPEYVLEGWPGTEYWLGRTGSCGFERTDA